MGSVCSLGKKRHAISSLDSLGNGSKSSANTQYSISASIVCNTICNPFRISREDAENLLQESYPGAFVFSHSISSEMFLSMSTGKYVCHHPILKYAQRYEIGGRNFKNIEEAVSFYRTNRLGDAVLTEQFNSMNEEQLESKHSHSLSSLPRMTKSKSKRVTFETSKKVSQTGQTSLISDENIPKTTQISLEEDLTSEQNEEMFKKIVQTAPRKSICRVQPEDSLSTSSGNMFKEEEF